MRYLAKGRLFLWLILLLASAMVAQAEIETHLIHVRGLPKGFPAPVAEADVPLLGINVALEQYSDAEMETSLARIAEGGFVWVRQSFYWSHVELETSDLDWSVPDRILTALAHYPRLRLVAVLDDDPAVPPADPDRFAAFAGAFAARYGELVDYYQVWDEPNLADRWGGGPASPPAYADLLACTSESIRAADPSARILLAGLAPTTESGPQNLSDMLFLDQLYRAGAAPYFDIVAGKPYGFDTGPDDRRTEGAVLNFSRLILLREVMVKRGDAGKAIWASHWGWNALPPGWAGAPSIWGQTDEATQAARSVAALERARTEWPWCGALILETYQPHTPPDDPHWGFALVGQDGVSRPIYHAVAEWSADLPDAASAGGYPALNRWATYEGDWRTGPMGADTGGDGDRATFRFDGPSIALTVRRGPYRAFLYATVDGEPANALPQDAAGRAYAVLYDKEHTIVTIPLATNLPAGEHSVEIVTEGGQGQWALVDWRVGTGPVRDGFGWKISTLVAADLALAVLLVCEARRIDWAALGNVFLAWPEWGQVALSIGLTGLLWVASGMSWGRDWGSSWLLVSLLVLPALATVFALRLDLGLTLVIFSAPFYLQPDTMFYRASSLPEVLVVLCGLGMVIRSSILAPPSRGREGRKGGGYLSLLDFSILLLSLAAVVASITAANRLAAVFELRAVFLIPILYYALLRMARLDDQARWRLVDGLVLGGTAMAIIGLAQYTMGINVVIAEGGLPRLQSVYPSPNNVGLYLCRVWPLLVAVGLWDKRGRRRLLYRLALLPVLLALLLSFSRGALLLGVPAALLAMGWRAGGRWRWTALTIVAAGALVLVPLLRMPRFASLLVLDQGTTFFRLELWRGCLTLLREHPWFGVGPGNFAAAYRTRYILPSAWQEFNLEHPHSIYLDHWTRLGVLGVIAGITVQMGLWRRLRRLERRNALALGIAGGMAALLAHGLVDNTLFFPDLMLTFLLMLVLSSHTSFKGMSILDQSTQSRTETTSTRASPIPPAPSLPSPRRVDPPSRPAP
jgi:O-antigen ligase